MELPADSNWTMSPDQEPLRFRWFDDPGLHEYLLFAAMWAATKVRYVCPGWIGHVCAIPSATYLGPSRLRWVHRGLPC